MNAYYKVILRTTIIALLTSCTASPHLDIPPPSQAIFGHWRSELNDGIADYYFSEDGTYTKYISGSKVASAKYQLLSECSPSRSAKYNIIQDGVITPVVATFIEGDWVLVITCEGEVIMTARFIGIEEQPEQR